MPIRIFSLAWSLLIFTTLALLSNQSLAVDVTALGGLNYAAPTQTLNSAEIHWTGDAGASYGLTVGIPVFLLPFEVETGIFLLNENSSKGIASVGTTLTRSSKMLQIPLVVRFNFDEHVGLGAGAYVAFAQGELDTSNGLMNRSDAGLIANVRARFNLAPPLYLILDARYQHGLTNRALALGDLYNTRSVQGFIGLQFALLSSHDSGAKDSE